MTPADEQTTFVALWKAGVETCEIARQLDIKVTTAQSRARRLQQQGLIQSRPRGGGYPSLRAKARQDGAPAPPATHAAPAPPAAERKEIQQWTVRLSKALIDHLKAVAYERRMPPANW